jgi:hypothetical protein
MTATGLILVGRGLQHLREARNSDLRAHAEDIEERRTSSIELEQLSTGPESNMEEGSEDEDDPETEEDPLAGADLGVTRRCE